MTQIIAYDLIKNYKSKVRYIKVYQTPHDVIVDIEHEIINQKDERKISKRIEEKSTVRI